jgi:hypothetical protein
MAISIPVRDFVHADAFGPHVKRRPEGVGNLDADVLE